MDLLRELHGGIDAGEAGGAGLGRGQCGGGRAVVENPKLRIWGSWIGRVGLGKGGL